jgi:small-conductance mechanosensitive channel
MIRYQVLTRQFMYRKIWNSRVRPHMTKQSLTSDLLPAMGLWRELWQRAWSSINTMMNIHSKHTYLSCFILLFNFIDHSLHIRFYNTWYNFAFAPRSHRASQWRRHHQSRWWVFGCDPPLPMPPWVRFLFLCTHGETFDRNRHAVIVEIT